MKRYVAGARHAHAGKLVWVEHQNKNSTLFIKLLEALRSTYRAAHQIILILDNYIVHKCEATEQWLSKNKEIPNGVSAHLLALGESDRTSLEGDARYGHSKPSLCHVLRFGPAKCPVLYRRAAFPGESTRSRYAQSVVGFGSAL